MVYGIPSVLITFLIQHALSIAALESNWTTESFTIHYLAPKAQKYAQQADWKPYCDEMATFPG